MNNKWTYFSVLENDTYLKNTFIRWQPVWCATSVLAKTGSEPYKRILSEMKVGNNYNASIDITRLDAKIPTFELSFVTYHHGKVVSYHPIGIFYKKDGNSSYTLRKNTSFVSKAYYEDRGFGKYFGDVLDACLRWSNENIS